MGTTMNRIPAISSRWILAGLLLALPFVACSGQQDGWLTAPEVSPSAERVTMDTVLSASNSGIREQTRLLITNSSEWEQFWRQVYDSRTPVPEMPTIDFGNHVVVAAGMGGRNTGGYAIAVESVAVAGDTLYAKVQETSPGEGCMVTQALTQPVHAVRVPAGNATTLVTVERTSTNQCN